MKTFIKIIKNACLSFIVTSLVFLSPSWGMKDEDDELVPNRVIKSHNDNEINAVTGIFFNIKHRVSGAHIDADASGKAIYMLGNAQIGNHFQQWSFTPVNYALNALICNFQYEGDPLDILKEQMKPMSLMANMSFPNNGNATLQQTIDEIRETTNTAIWSFEKSSSATFSNTFKVTVEAYAKAKANLFSLLSAQLQVGGSVADAFTWSWTKDSLTSQSKTFTNTRKHHIKQIISIPPHTTLEAFSIINWANNVNIPFTAEVKITAIAERLRKNGTVTQMVPVGLDALKLFLRHEKYQGQIIRTEGDAVYAQIKGTVTADVGLDIIFGTRSTSFLSKL